MAATKEIQAQLVLLPERVSVLETKVENINEKLIDIKADVREMHDCLDQTRDLLADQLKTMAEASNSQHNDLYSKISELEKVKNKYTTYALIALAFAAGTGWLNSVHLPQLLKLIGV
jgi:chromosome segregation ATPase